MATTLTVTDEALAELRPLFRAVEGDCEVWEDREVVTRLLIRGVMAYGQSAGRPFAEMATLAGELRRQLDRA